MEKVTNPIGTEKVILGILELEIVRESDVTGGGKTSIFLVTSFMNGP